jgi:hypothetical protein
METGTAVDILRSKVSGKRATLGLC